MTPAPRSVPLDALRGFALLGIVLVNAPFFAQPLWAEPAVAHAADAAALWFTHAFATGKFFLIFSFLFGFGFAASLARAEAERRPARGRVLRRLLGLLVFGLLHAAFLFFGDILMLYAVLGLALWACRDWPPRRLLAAAVLILAAAVLCQSAVLLAAAADARPAPAPAPGVGYLDGFLGGAAHRLTELPGVLAFGLLFNAPAALAMFLAGLALARIGAMPPDIPALRRPALAALAVGGLGSGALTALALSGPGDAPADAAAWIGTVLFCALAPVLSFGMAGTVLAAAHRNPSSRPVRWLAATGSATLSGYILHSALLGAVFNGWGLGLYGRVGPAGCLVLGLLVFAAVGIAINLWKRRFRHGPDEWLLRSFADLEWKPWRRERPYPTPSSAGQ